MSPVEAITGLPGTSGGVEPPERRTGPQYPPWSLLFTGQLEPWMADWSILEEEGWEATLRGCAVNVFHGFQHQADVMWSVDDLYQEGAIILALKADQYRAEKGGPRGSHARQALKADLKDVTTTNRRRIAKQTSLDNLMEKGRHADENGAIHGRDMVRHDYEGGGSTGDLQQAVG